MDRAKRILLFRIICAASLTAAGIVFGFYPLLSFMSLYFYIAAAVTVGFDVALSAVNGIIHGHILDENFLMLAGSICAFILGEYAEGTMILLFYQVGELFQAIAVGRSRRSIAELMDIRPDYANLVKTDGIEQVDPFDVAVGDIILVEPGEKIPLDGVVVEGLTSVDTSSLTGESAPIDLFEGSAVISGSINLTSPIKIRVEKEFESSTVSKILELAENASSRKAKTENFVRSFAKYYTPIVVIAAVLIGAIPPLLFSGELSVWLSRAVMFVVISCPCALVVSVPMAFFGALGGASRAGILVKGSNYLEALAETDTAVFDKTGTLTKGSFRVTDICPAEGKVEAELKRVAAICEAHSSHPIALSVKEAFGSLTAEDGKYETVQGKGVTVTTEKGILAAGNLALMEELGLRLSPPDTPHTVIHLYEDGYLGYLVISDEIKPTSKEAISGLKAGGIRKTVMLTGDRKASAEWVAKELGLDEYYPQLLPSDKVTRLEDIISKGGRTFFVGDGVNDAPVLALADVGIAMGGLGSDAAIEAADIVIMNDDPALIIKAVKIARKALRISKQNIFFSIAVKFLFLGLSLFGISNIWMAVFADVGVLIIAVANSMRTLKK